jgi:ABC-2 type transport system permease protein
LFGAQTVALNTLLGTITGFALFVFPREAMPVPINALAMLIPTTPAIFGFVKLNQMGASWAEIRPEFFNMAALLLLYAGVAGWAVRRRRRR